MMNPAVSIVDQYCFDVYVGSKNIAGTKKGKLDIAPLNHLPLLPSGPGDLTGAGRIRLTQCKNTIFSYTLTSYTLFFIKKTIYYYSTFYKYKA